MVCTRRKNYNSPTITISRKKNRNSVLRNSVPKSQRLTTQTVPRKRRKLTNKTIVTNKTYNLLVKNTTSPCNNTVNKNDLDFVYRTIIIENMTDFNKLNKYAMSYKYAFYIVTSEETNNIMVGRVQTEQLKRKFCNFLNRHNDVVNSTNARLYLVLSKTESFIRDMNRSVYSNGSDRDYEFSITPISWKIQYKSLKSIIDMRDRYIKLYQH